MEKIDIITSPITDYFESRGFDTQVVDGQKIVKKFSSLNDELNALYNGVALRIVNDNAILELRGKDTLDFLHRITTNELKNIVKQDIRRTIFTTEKGRIIDVATLLNFEEYQLLISSNEHKKMVMSWIDKYKIMDDVNVADASEKYYMLELIGPQCESFMMLVCGNKINELQPDSFKVFSTDGMLFFLAKLNAGKNSFKYWVLADWENTEKLLDYMSENKGPFDYSPIGEEAYEIYRVEQGIPKAPNELNDSFNPHEVKLLDLVNFSKGCYIGQEVIARLDTYEKVQKYLAGVEFIDEPVYNLEYILKDAEGAEAGKITSVVDSVRLKKHIGLAFVRKAYADAGTTLTAESDNADSVKVIIRNLPFRK